MRRRTVLATAGALSLAGCLADSSSPGTGDPGNGNDDPEGDNETDDPSADDGTDDPDADDEPAEPNRSFDAALERPAHVLSMNEQLAEEGPSQITGIDEVNETTREAVTAAIENERYETDDPPEALLEGLHRLWYVSREGTAYELSWTMPEHVVTATEVDESAVDPDATIGMMDDRIRVLGTDNREIAGAVNAVVDREEGATGRAYRATVFDAALESFLEEYDFVAYPHDGDGGPEAEGYVELEYAYEDPGPPYSVTAEPLPDEERYGAVVDASSFSPPVAEAFRSAAEHREHRTDDLPDGLRDAIGSEDYVRVGDRVYDPALQDVESGDAPITLEIVDVDESERAFTLALENDRDGGLEIFHGAPNTFGVLSATDADGERATLWSDDYAESDHVHVGERDGEPAITVNDIGLTTELGPDGSVEATYQVDPEWGFRAGDWTVEDTLGVQVNEESAPYPYTIELSVPELET